MILLYTWYLLDMNALIYSYHSVSEYNDRSYSIVNVQLLTIYPDTAVV